MGKVIKLKTAAKAPVENPRLSARALRSRETVWWFASGEKNESAKSFLRKNAVIKGGKSK